MRKNLYVLSATRSGIGTFGGQFKNTPLVDMATQVVASAVTRAQIDPSAVGHVAMGHVLNTEPQDMYLSRAAAIHAGIPQSTPAFNLNRLCGSGLSAVIAAAQMINEDQCEIAVGAGAENMSRAPFWVPTNRFGQRLGDATLVDAMVGALSDPFDGCHMGITAERVAAKHNISRADQDALAALSHERAATAIAEGRFESQLTAIEVKSRKGTQNVVTDEHVKADTTPDSLAKLRPAFDREGSVTAGNASGINDAAAALVLASETGLKQAQGEPLARLVDYAFVGVDPKLMGLGPVPATQALLAKTGLKISDIDVWEINEAFAAQALGVCLELGLDPEQVNPNGSGISLGHPIGATGAIVATKAIYELHRTQGKYAIATLCIGGGQGVAALFERV